MHKDQILDGNPGSVCQIEERRLLVFKHLRVVEEHYHPKHERLSVQPVELLARRAAQIVDCIDVQQEESTQANKIENVLSEEATVGRSEKHKDKLQVRQQTSQRVGLTLGFHKSSNDVFKVVVKPAHATKENDNISIVGLVFKHWEGDII